MSEYKFKQSNPGILFLLSNLTLGAYVPYWFISRKNPLQYLTSKLNFSTLYIMLGLYIFFLAYYVIGGVFLNELGQNLMDSISWIVTFWGFGILYYSTFRIVEAVEENMGERVFNRFFVLLLHIWYIQFVLNKTQLVRREE
ncbi:hypothetical protein [Paenisporosarcina sp. OV554]|uniref:hypothetical protein n=1 Tax=Paenisporosarcina sp. OV554 TaxID=2135694 RepID=UPI000D3CFE91|nr:hypothetical protein [Paenisporosarcina sp. OV554]PUB16776.1 hypothetical protein C8K15_102206 [Paenisporosarcina sp. OV554]